MQLSVSNTKPPSWAWPSEAPSSNDEGSKQSALLEAYGYGRAQSTLVLLRD